MNARIIKTTTLKPRVHAFLQVRPHAVNRWEGPCWIRRNAVMHRDSRWIRVVSLQAWVLSCVLTPSFSNFHLPALSTLRAGSTRCHMIGHVGDGGCSISLGTTFVGVHKRHHRKMSGNSLSIRMVYLILLHCYNGLFKFNPQSTTLPYLAIPVHCSTSLLHFFSLGLVIPQVHSFRSRSSFSKRNS